MAAATEVVSEAATAGLQSAHGGKLVNLQAPQSEWQSLMQVRARALLSCSMPGGCMQLQLAGLRGTALSAWLPTRPAPE